MLKTLKLSLIIFFITMSNVFAAIDHNIAIVDTKHIMNKSLAATGC